MNDVPEGEGAVALEHLRIDGRRPVTEEDVWAAADGLLLAGDRATVARVREVLGKGSPNTVAPLLDGWYRSLGKRIRDPKAFTEPNGLPAKVAKAAEALWQAASVDAKAEAALEIGEIRRLAAEKVNAATAAAEEAERRRDRAVAESQALRAEADEVRSRLDAEKVAHGTTTGRLAEVTAQLGAAKDREAATKAALEDVRRSSQAALEELRRSSQTAIVTAEERADAAHRRAALEIDKEREARKEWERRAEAAVRKLEKTQADAAAQHQADTAEIRRLVGDLASAETAALAAQTELTRERANSAALQNALDNAREGAARSAQEATTLRQMLGRPTHKAKKTGSARPRLRLSKA